MVYYLHRLGIRTMHELRTTGSAGLSGIICDVIYTALYVVYVRIVNNKLFFSIFGLRVRVSMMSYINHMMKHCKRS